MAPTPEACFEGLHQYTFAPHYTEMPDLEGGSHFFQEHVLEELFRAPIRCLQQTDP
jgi:hypothetical protein